MTQARVERQAGELTTGTGASQDFPKLPTRENGEHVNEGDASPAPPAPPPHPLPGELTDPQRIAIEIMLAGWPMSEAAAQAGVTRRTLYTWRHHHAAFRAELERRRSDLWDETADRLRALLEPAVRTLEQQIRSPYDQDRYRAARTVLRLAKVGAAIPVKQPEEGGVGEL